MKKILIALIFAASLTGLASAETLTLTTYYPAPFGAYDRLQLVPRAALNNPCAAGTMYVRSSDGQIQFCKSDQTWGALGGVWTQNGNFINLTNYATLNPNVAIGPNLANVNVDLNVGAYFGAAISGGGGGGGIFGSNLATNVGYDFYTPYSHASYGYAGMHTAWGNIQFLAQNGATTQNTTVTPTARLFIGGSNGNIGIGTTSPTAKLQIVPGNATGIYINSGTGTGVDIDVTSGIALRGQSSSNGYGVIGTTNTGYGVYGSAGGFGWAGFFAGKAYADTLGVGTTAITATIEAAGGGTAISATATGTGLSARATSSGGIGVSGTGGFGANGVGVLGSSSGGGWGGWFNGKLYTDYLQAGGGGGGTRATFNGDIVINGNSYANAHLANSSRELKENISNLSLDSALAAVKNLEPVTFHYKNDEEKDIRVGFIAEDVPELVAMTNRKSIDPMDIVAVLTKVVQHQQRLIEEQQKEIDLLKAKIK